MNWSELVETVNDQMSGWFDQVILYVPGLELVLVKWFSTHSQYSACGVHGLTTVRVLLCLHSLTIGGFFFFFFGIFFSITRGIFHSEN